MRVFSSPVASALAVPFTHAIRRACAMPDLPPGRAFIRQTSHARPVSVFGKTGASGRTTLPRSGMANARLSFRKPALAGGRA